MNNVKPGQVICFDLETWPEDQMVLKEVNLPVIRISKDPMGFHPTKAIVEYEGDFYGIPLCEIKSLEPAPGEQLLINI